MTLTLTEIKKELYKQKPTADFIRANNGSLLYACIIKDGSALGENIPFEIPLSDIGDADFYARMPAQLLIRYIVMPETTTP